MLQTRRTFRQGLVLSKEQEDLLQSTGTLQHHQQDELTELEKLTTTPDPAQFFNIQNMQQEFPSRNYPTDGIIICKVNILPKLDNTKIHNQSLPFFTARYGYKMCIHVIIEFVKGNTPNLAVYFAIMRGEYDDLLKWPFSSKVSFILIDPSCFKRHIVQTFNPDPQSSSFCQPVESMNIPIGFPNFASVSEDFVKDNSIFIKCIVDVSNIVHP